jgi:hypothetical protein
MVLIVVLIAIALLTLTAFTFTKLMLAERKAAQSSLRGVQARALAESGLEMARQFVVQDQSTQDGAGGYYDNAGSFQGVLVADDDQPTSRGRVTLIAPLVDQDGNISSTRYGLENESDRLNLNLVMQAEQAKAGGGEAMLMNLPGMTQDIADSILDWMDPNDETRGDGASSDYYAGLPSPYVPRNGPLGSVEELLLVQGITPDMMFGSDVNRNFLVDSNESTNLPDVDNSDGSMNCGWASYLTIYSQESNTQSDGTPRININKSDLQTLYSDLQTALGDPNMAQFIVAFRASTLTNGVYVTKADPRNFDPTSLTASYTLVTVLDVIGVTLQYQPPAQPGPRGGPPVPARPVTWTNPFSSTPDQMSTYLPKLMDSCWISGATTIPGRININQAPLAVLQTIPGLTSDMIQSILTQRVLNPTLDTADHADPTWLLTEGIVPDLTTMKAILPFVTCGGNVFRATAVGFFEGGGPASRIEAVFDATAQPPTVLFWRDLSPLGRGYPMDTLNQSQ